MSKKIIETFSDSTTRSLTNKNSGSLIFIDLTSNNVTLNLPPPEAGLNFEFIIVKPTNDFILQSVNSSYALTALMYFGQKSDGTGNTLTVDSPTAGDRILLDCDGTSWHGSIICKTISEFTLSTE